MTYWCLAGNGWEWGNGMIITSDYGSFPHSLLSTSKLRDCPLSRRKPPWPLLARLEDCQLIFACKLTAGDLDHSGNRNHIYIIHISNNIIYILYYVILLYIQYVYITMGLICKSTPTTRRNAAIHKPGSILQHPMMKFLLHDVMMPHRTLLGGDDRGPTPMKTAFSFRLGMMETIGLRNLA